MEIDIISYTEAQLEALTEKQMLEVQSAQLKKNALDQKLAEEKLKEKHRLIDNGTFLSGIWEKYCAKLQEEYELQVENVKDSLLFYLASSTTEDTSSAPYTVDYSLSPEERLAIVKAYYINSFSDSESRMAAFREDKIAMQYLGELYAPLYDALLAYKD